MTSDDKASITRWETVAAYDATFPDGDTEGRAEVSVQIGEHDGHWYVRTSDDAGGSDEADEMAYDSRETAVAAAERFAAEHDRPE